MKLGIISDLHMEFSPWELEREDDVFYICAGDIHSNFIMRERWVQQKWYHMFHILGNHDYYGQRFPRWEYQCDTRTLPNGLTIYGATLWTDLRNYQDWVAYERFLIDKSRISEIDQDTYNRSFFAQKDFLMKSGADIIVSHHAPSYMSLHPKFQGQSTNPAFMSELSNEILAMTKPPKLWIHGHVHSPFDYMIGETRVVCNPRGYPGENSYFDSYKPKIVEII